MMMVMVVVVVVMMNVVLWDTMLCSLAGIYQCSATMLVTTFKTT
jgi:hypothetical protein